MRRAGGFRKNRGARKNSPVERWWLTQCFHASLVESTLSETRVKSSPWWSFEGCKSAFSRMKKFGAGYWVTGASFTGFVIGILMERERDTELQMAPGDCLDCPGFPLLRQRWQSSRILLKLRKFLRGFWKAISH